MPDSLLLLHGFTGSRDDWQAFLPSLENIVEPHAIDIIGHGDTHISDDVDDYSMPKIAAHIIEQMKHPFHLLGYSMGGRLALYIACHYPQKVQSLILESASAGLKTATERETRRQADNQLADNIEAKGIKWFVNYWEAISLWDTQTAAQKASLREKRLQNHPLGLANSLRGMGTGVMPSLWDELPNLQMPVQLIVGELDSKFVAINQQMVEAIPNANLDVVANAGHTVHLEQAQAFTEIVLTFLKQLTAS